MSNMSNLLEIYDLLEWGEYGASSRFWSEAKAGRLDVISFWNAYYSDLSKLGLSDLFDTEYKELKEKSSYGKIKKAAEENPDSWAVKALLKVWVLQFKDGVKSNIRIKQEEDEQKLADRKTELAEVEAQIPEFKRIFEETGNRIFSEVAKQANEQIRVNNKYLEEIKKVSNGFVDNISFTASEIDETNTIKIDFYYSEPSTSNFNANFIVTIEEIFGKNTNYNYRKLKDTLYGANRDNEVSLRPVYNAEGMTVEKMKEKAEKLFSGIATILKTDLGNIGHSERIKATYDKTIKAVEDSKKAQNAVNTGKPVDPDFIAEVLAVFKNGLKKADAESASWASWRYDDGDSGAAFEHEKYKTMNAAAVYLFNCNWRSYVNDREIATWRNTDSEKALEDALSKTFNAASQELSIEIIK